MEELAKSIETTNIVGILAQIQKVNVIIDIHRLHGEDSMVKQFERQRDDFLEELNAQPYEGLKPS